MILASAARCLWFFAESKEISLRNVLTWKWGSFERSDPFATIFVRLALSLLIEAFLSLNQHSFLALQVCSVTISPINTSKKSAYDIGVIDGKLGNWGEQPFSDVSLDRRVREHSWSRVETSQDSGGWTRALLSLSRPMGELLGIKVNEYLFALRGEWKIHD